MEEFGGDHEGVLSIEKFGGYKTEVKERIEERERQALRNKVRENKHLEMYGGLREDIGIQTKPNGLREKAETAISCRGPGLTRKKRYSSSREEEDVATNMCSCGTTIESRTHLLIVGECVKYTRRNEMR